MLGNEFSGRARCHHAEPRKGSRNISTLDRQRAYERPILTRLDVVAAVNVRPRAFPNVSPDCWHHGRHGSKRNLGVVRLHRYRKSDLGLAATMVEEDDERRSGAAPVGSTMDAVRKLLQEPLCLIVPIEGQALVIAPG